MSQHKIFRAIATTSTLVLVAAGCGFGSSDNYPTPQELSDHLVTITDLPTGWSETQRQAFETRSNENPSIDPSIFCPEAKVAAVPLTALAGGSGADVEMQFKKSGEGARMMRLQAWSNADAQKYYDALLEVVTICDGKHRNDLDGAEVQTEIIEDKTIGDESVSWTDEVIPPKGSGDKFETIGRTTVARFNNIIMVLQIGDAAPVGTAQLLNEADWWEIVTRAANKVDDLA